MTSPPLVRPAAAGLPAPHEAGQVVGIFDSGIGGLSVLRALRARLPSTAMHYVADSAYAPYGERDDDYVAARSLRIARHLVAQGAAVIVVACNTATAAAVQTLRATWPHLVVVGVEPGIKPAVLATRNGRVGVLATPGTLASDKFRRLMHGQAGQAKIMLQPCPGLAGLIERGNFESEAISQALRTFCQPLAAAGVDTVVLGCTHYAFIRAAIEREMGPGVRIVDTAEAVARHAAHLFSERVTAPDPDALAPRSLRLETTGDPEAVMAVVASMCGGGVSVHHVALDD